MVLSTRLLERVPSGILNANPGAGGTAHGSVDALTWWAGVQGWMPIMPRASLGRSSRQDIIDANLPHRHSRSGDHYS